MPHSVLPVKQHIEACRYVWWSQSISKPNNKPNNPLFIHLHVFVICFSVMQADNLGYFNIIDTLMKSSVWINQIFAIYQKKMYVYKHSFLSFYILCHSCPVNHWFCDLRKKSTTWLMWGLNLGSFDYETNMLTITPIWPAYGTTHQSLYIYMWWSLSNSRFIIYSFTCFWSWVIV